MGGRGVVCVVLAITAVPPAAGAAELTSDFDGDGRADVAVGVAQEEPSNAFLAGAVHVIYGSPRGLSPRGDQLWHQDVPGVKGEVDDHESAGPGASGDLNCDGFDDLAVPIDDRLPSGVQAGAVSVLFGGAEGLTARGDLFLRQGSLGGSEGASRQGHFGSGIAIGNFGRGPCADLAVADARENINVGGEVVTSAGAISVFYGKPRGLQEQRAAIRQDSPGVEGEPEEYDSFGLSLAAGNVGGSGYDELIVGNYEELVGFEGDAGSMHVLYGSKRGLQGGPELYQEDFGEVTESGDELGRNISVGNVGRGAYEDIVIGIDDEDFDEPSPSSGVAYVIYGRDDQLDGSNFEILDPRALSSPVGGFGISVGIADLERGGPQELALTAQSSPSGGLVFVYPTNSTGVLTDPSVFSLSTPGIIGEPYPGDRFAYDLAAGDFDGSGIADVLVSDDEDTVSGHYRAGSVHAIYAGRRTLGSQGDRILHQDKRGMRSESEPYEAFGESLLQQR